MRKLRRIAPVAIALSLASLSSSCGLLFRNRPILRHGKAPTQAQTLLAATRDELNGRIQRIYGAINSFQATMDMTPSVGSVYKGQITEIKDVRAYVMFRKAADIHIIGYTPVIRTKYFDMASNGTGFRFSLPQNNTFFEGTNDAPATSKNKIENLRPEAFLSSMLVRPADPEMEVPVLVDQTDEENARYILYLMRKGKNGEILQYAARSIWFDRLDLSIERQQVYDTDGEILSDTRYARWQPYNGVLFPAHIDINRWKDGYGVVMDLTQMQMNKALTDDQFVLPQPEGTKLQRIGAAKPGDNRQGAH